MRVASWQEEGLVLIIWGADHQAPRCQDGKGRWPAPDVAAFRAERGGWWKGLLPPGGPARPALLPAPNQTSCSLESPGGREEALILKRLKKNQADDQGNAGECSGRL